MLGQIDFAPWQCLAELIDNSIDAFIDALAAGSPLAAPRINIQLPNETQLKQSQGVISIKDNARGMSIENMKDAVRAGYSGNDPVEKMGLFGMGFNISTARMGRRTEVWTTRPEDSDWTGIVIDFDNLERNKTFHAPMEIRPKSEAELNSGAHGTEIRISRLEADRVRPLIKGAGKRKTRERLGKIYGRVMQRLGIIINYDGDVVTPRAHCVWDPNRSVDTQSFGMVPARIDIDKTLDSRHFCTTCWVWLNDDEITCSACGENENVITRQRRLRGWIGVQRYFDKEHYGIDLIRNGRVIEELDKTFFTYTDENSETLFEYPIDATHWGGRIVGELEIDFVRVSHQKDSFDKLDPEWRKVVELVRGSSPLQPKIAERMGLAKNDSPLARLFTGYRKGTAGLKDLVPGTAEGTGLNSGVVREYVEKFYAGDPAYQNDEKWYELVLQAERWKRGDSSGAEKAAGDFPIDEDEATQDGGDVGEVAPIPPATNPIVEKEAEPELDGDLSRIYEVDELPGDIAVRVIAYKHKRDIGGLPFSVKPEGYSFRFDYNIRAPFFEESLETPLDHLLVDLSQHFLTLAAETPRNFPISRIAHILRNRYFPAQSGDLTASANSASSLLDELRRHYDEFLPEVAPIAPAQLSATEAAHIRRAALKAGFSLQLDGDAIITTGKFGRFVSNSYIVELVRMWPSLAMDGRFFSTPYSGLAEDLKNISLAELIESLQDISWLADEGASAVNKDTGWRLRYSRALASLKLLLFWRT